MRPQAFANDGRGRLIDQGISSWGGYFEQRALGRGMARIDYNVDGADDLVIVHQDRPAILLANRRAWMWDTQDHRGSLRLVLHGTSANRDAIGAVALLTMDGSTRALPVPSGDGYACSNERVITVGIPGDSKEVSLEVRWPSGSVERLENVPRRGALIHAEGGPWLRGAKFRDPPRR
jgi:hypothetical protein